MGFNVRHLPVRMRRRLNRGDLRSLYSDDTRALKSVSGRRGLFWILRCPSEIEMLLVDGEAVDRRLELQSK